jgi:hypothetical protein
MFQETFLAAAYPMINPRLMFATQRRVLYGGME